MWLPSDSWLALENEILQTDKIEASILLQNSLNVNIETIPCIRFNTSTSLLITDSSCKSLNMLILESYTDHFLTQPLYESNDPNLLRTQTTNHLLNLFKYWYTHPYNANEQHTKKINSLLESYELWEQIRYPIPIPNRQKPYCNKKMSYLSCPECHECLFPDCHIISHFLIFHFLTVLNISFRELKS